MTAAVSTRPRGQRARRAAVTDQVVAYLRVSTDEQVQSGAGLDAQRAAIEAEVARRGWTVVAWCIDEGVSGAKDPNARPAFAEALALLDDCAAGVLVATKVDRLSRSLHDFTGLMERAQRSGWALVALDLAVDTSTPSGELMAHTVGSFAQFERRLIGQRTRDALAAKRAAGVRLGRPSSLDPAVRARIVDDRAVGVPWRRIVEALNAEGVPTGQGGARWHLSSVQAAHRSALADAAR